MIRSFECKNTEALSKGNHVRQFENIAKIARRKLRQLEIAGRLDDLKVPPGNHLDGLPTVTGYALKPPMILR